MPISTSGWSYIFSLVFVATITWLPLEKIINKCDNISLEWKDLVLVFTSAMLSITLALLFSWYNNSSSFLGFLTFPAYDDFFTICIELDKKAVIVGTKNDKVYVGILLKYPKNPRSNYESQSISILPLISGGRNNNTKEVKWGGFYPDFSEQFNGLSSTNYCEIVIPRREIVTFGKFNIKTFEHFNKDEQDPKPTDTKDT